MYNLLVVGLLALMVGCSGMQESPESQAVHHTSVCILSMCEGTDKIERVGDLSAGDAIDESENDESEVTQGEDAETDADLGGLL